jgi:16S rRNA processing protein RimM
LTIALRDLYAVGRILKVFGIRGECVVQPMTTSPARFRKLKRVYLASPEDIEAGRSIPDTPVTVEQVGVQQRGIRVKFVEVTDRTAAESLIGYLLLVDEQHRARVPRGTYFVHDIIGMTVQTADGAQVGIVRDVLHMPAQDVYAIDTPGGELLLPAVNEFILSVDTTTRRMTVHLIEGMRV